ncbi:S1C family serine protease [Rathayibacter sp. CAU 1779]
MTDTPKDPAETPEPTPQEQGSQDSVADTPRTDEHDATLPRAEFDAIRRDRDSQTSADAQPADNQPADVQSAAAGGAASAPAQNQTSEQPAAEQPTAETPTVERSVSDVAANQTQPTEPLPPQVAGAAVPSQGVPSQPDSQNHGAQNHGAQNQGAQNPYAAQQAGYHYGQQYAQQGNYQYGTQPGAFGQPTYAGQPPYAQGQPGQPGQPQKPAKQKDGKGNRAGLLITGFVLAGLLGGGVGAGVVGIYAANSGNSKAVTSTGATSVTVNDPQTATDVTAVASKVSPSVVTINVTGSQEAGTGSGVILSSDGYVLTNTHVVTLDGETGSASITVTTNDGKIYKAKVVGTDPVLDLAVIQLQNASGLTPASFADSDKVNVGDQTIAIGAPLGLSGTVTNGIVSALNRSIQIASSAAPDQDQQDNGDNGDNSPFNFWNFDQNGGSSGQSSAQSTISLPVIQTDAAINPGNSGGPLLNGKGQVMGINVAIASAGSSDSSSDQSGSIGVGFAIPSNVAQRVADEIIKNGKATSGLLGATVADSTSDSSATTVGALVKSVTSGGAAAGAGLQAGDIVTNFNGKPITNATDLTAQVRALAGGSKATIEYQRNGQSKQSDVTLGTLSS